MDADRWRRISEIFASVRAQGPDARTVVLDEASVGSAALRADVEELLRHDLPSTPAIDVLAAQLARVASTSAVGARLGSYTLQALIGEGGMGQVYRAYDAALGREVAIKVLPPEYAIDPDRRARFEREARLLASLNHPHIGGIYGIAEGTGLHGLVLELVEGETLAARLKKAHEAGRGSRGLAVREALTVARQVAEALEAAHEKGIIHRDLKPANIKIAPDGIVKVLDFGLAKAVAHDTDSSDEMSSTAPIASRDPHVSAIVGTAAYMSPEQAQGTPVDKRSDIWAFGCVVYEMLTGTRAFDVSARASDAIEPQPDWGALPADVPPTIGGLLRRCLQRDQKRRLRDIGEARLILEDLLAVPLSSMPAVANGRRRLAVWSAMSLGALIAVAVFGWPQRLIPEAAPLRVRRVAVPVTTQQRPASFLGIAISPTGDQLAYVADEGSHHRLCIRALDGTDTNCVEGTEGASYPFFSPDGEWIGYFVDGQLRRVAVGGGPSVVITNRPQSDGGLTTGAGGGTWAPNDSIIFSDGRGLWRVPASGERPPVAVSEPDRLRGEISYLRPTLLPDGHTLLYVVWLGPGWDEREVIAQRLETGEKRVLLRGAGVVRYARSGHLVYSRAGTLMAVRFDPSRLDVAGAPVAVQGDVREATMNADWDLSADGSLAFVDQSRDVFMRLPVWVDQSGGTTPLPGLVPAYYQNPVIAPDGTRAAFMITSATIDIWVYDFARAALTRVTTEGSSQMPVWSGDGTRIAYRATRAGFRNLYWRRVDGMSGEDRLTTSPNVQTPWSISRDGRILAFAEAGERRTHVGLLSLRDGGGTRVLASDSSVSTKSKISPDGRLVAYVSDRSGPGEVYVQALDGTDRRVQISVDGGTDPLWAPDGRELYYRRGSAIMAARLEIGKTLRVSHPSKLFDGFLYRSEPVIDYDIHPDGRRFLMIQPVRPDPPLTHVNLVLNWHEELNVRLPASR